MRRIALFALFGGVIACTGPESIDTGAESDTDTDTDTDSDTDTDADTDSDTDTDTDVEPVRELPALGCEGEIWYVAGPSEIYYQMVAEDDDGLLIYTEGDDELDGQIDWRNWYVWIDADHLDTWTEDFDGDDVADLVTNYIWTGDDLTEQTFDYGLDGAFEDRVTRTYDDAGHVLLRLQDADDDGTIDDRMTFVWNEDFSEATAETDLGDDGSIDRRETWTGLDADQQPLHYELDEGADGTIDEITDYTRQADGRIIEYRLDRNGDGTWDREQFLTWNPDSIDDWETAQTIDYKAGAVENEWYQTLSLYPVGSADEGKRMTITMDEGNDGSQDYSLEYTWYCAP